MPYYGAGDYYQAGDNYAAGGLSLRSIGRGLKRAAGAVARTALGFVPGGNVINALLPSPTTQGGRAMDPVPGVTGVMQRMVPGGETGYVAARRKRLNPLNISALRRAMRRAKGFERQAKRVGSFFSPGKTYRLKGRRPRRKA